MRTALYRPLLSVLVPLVIATGCEQQVPPATANSPTEAEEGASGGSQVLPGSTGYYGALSGAKRTAENTVQQADDYNRKLEDQMDDLFKD